MAFLARIAEAEREGWLGEIDGLHVSLTGAGDKIAQTGKAAARGVVELGMPEIADHHGNQEARS